MGSEQSKQKEAVYTAISSVLAEAGITINEGDNFATHLNRELRAQVTEILVEGFNSGKISLDKPREDDAELRTYCSGLTSNWLRKDTRMNGGIKYEPKNPGSRAGSTDPQVKAMRTLLQTRDNLSDEDKKEIQGAIDRRVAEVRKKSPTAVKELTEEQVTLLKEMGLERLVSA
jgi:hypothetical protein